MKLTREALDQIFIDSGCEGYFQTDQLLDLIDQHENYLIGEDENVEYYKLQPNARIFRRVRNELRQEQRERKLKSKGYSEDEINLYSSDSWRGLDNDE